MRLARQWPPIISLFLLPFLVPEAGAAQGLMSVGVTPTYQASLQVNQGPLPGSEYRAYGVMLGMNRSGSWWNPHVWFQRYRVESDMRGDAPEKGRSRTDGWSLSLGPAIQFLRSETWRGEILPQISMGSAGPRALDSGVGVHLGFRGGFFQPQLFGRFQTHGSEQFWTLGVGVTMEVIWARGQTPGDYRQ